MSPTTYKLTSDVTGFSEGDILDVTARFGDWHQYTLKLEATPRHVGSKTVLVSEEPAGFSESEILDPTARFGDWHEYELAFDPISSPTPSDDSGPLTLTMAKFEAVTAPVEATA